MHVTIRLPAAIQRLIGGEEAIEVSAETVEQAMEALGNRYDVIRQRLFSPNGQIRPSVSIFLNNAPPAVKLGTPLNEGDTLVVFQPVGGG